MSAFVVEKATIDAIVGAWISFAGPFNNSCDRAEKADATGQMLWNENYRSVNFRYNEAGTAPKYKFQEAPLPPSRFQAAIPIVLKLLDCYEYQACETPDYYETEAHKFIETLRREVGRRLKGYEEAPWGTDDRNVFLKDWGKPKREVTQ